MNIKLINFAKNIYLSVFNKNINESSKMKGQTKIFIYLLIILSFITLFSISCNNNKDKTGTEERKLSYYAGDWWGKRKSLWIVWKSPKAYTHRFHKAQSLDRAAFGPFFNESTGPTTNTTNL